MSGIWKDQWIYALAPPLGAMLGLGMFKLVASEYRRALTGKLCSAPNYRSLFKGDVEAARTTHFRKPSA
jgi:aquaporin Z